MYWVLPTIIFTRPRVVEATGQLTRPHNFIQSGQAFFIQGPVSGTTTLTFNEGDKASGSDPNLLRVSGAVTSVQPQLRANLYSVIGGKGVLADGTLVQYGEGYKNGFDNLDARKIFGSAENMSVFSSGQQLAIERRSPIVSSDTIFYQLNGIKAQGYRLEYVANGLSAYGVEGYIEDNYLKTRKPLNLEDTTTLDFTVTSVAASYAPDRFRVVFKTPSPKVLKFPLVSLTASQKEEQVLVDWKVKDELDVKTYEVEKSTDGVSFISMTTVNARNTGEDSYEWNDDKPVGGYNYYRIKVTDMQGKITYTAVVKVLLPEGKPSISIRPNPITDGIIHLHFVNEPEGHYMIRLLNPLGQTIVAKQIVNAGGHTTQDIKWNFNLAHGVYQLEIVKPAGTVQVIKVVY